MDNLDRGLIGIGLIGTLVLSCAIPYGVGRECKNDLERLKSELSHAKRDVAAAEIDAQTLARIKSIQERLNTFERETIELSFSATTLSGIINTRVYFLEQRVAELESIIRESNLPANDSPTRDQRDPVEPTTPPDVPATRPQPRRRFAKFRDLEEGEYFTDADGWWLVCLASIAVIVAACVAMIYASYYTLTH